MSQEPKVTRFGALPLIDSELATKAYVDSGGGGGLTFAKVVKAVDESVTSSTVLQDDDEIFFTPAINNVYHVVMLLVVNSPSTPDLQEAWSVPAGATMEKLSATWRSGSANAIEDWLAADNHPTVAGVQLLELHGRLTMAGTAGTANWQWAQNASNANPTSVLRGSLMLVWEQ